MPILKFFSVSEEFNSLNFLKYLFSDNLQLYIFSQFSTTPIAHPLPKNFEKKIIGSDRNINKITKIEVNINDKFFNISMN